MSCYKDCCEMIKMIKREIKKNKNKTITTISSSNDDSNDAEIQNILDQISTVLSESLNNTNMQSGGGNKENIQTGGMISPVYEIQLFLIILKLTQPLLLNLKILVKKIYLLQVQTYSHPVSTIWTI